MRTMTGVMAPAQSAEGKLANNSAQDDPQENEKTQQQIPSEAL